MRNALLFSISIIASSPCAAADGLPTDDPTLRPYQITTKEYYGRCGDRGLSHVEESGCFRDQIDALRREVEAAYRAKLKPGAVTSTSDNSGPGTPKERLDKVRSVFGKSQKAWKAYTDTVCDGEAKIFEINGGNGGDLAYAQCTIRHYVARLNELRN